MGEFNNNLFHDMDYSLDEIAQMSEESIELYNSNPNHTRKIRDKFELAIMGAIPLIFLSALSNRTQKSQRKYLWRSHFIIYSILIALIIIISACA